jgi:hypothetical protein
LVPSYFFSGHPSLQKKTETKIAQLRIHNLFPQEIKIKMSETKSTERGRERERERERETTHLPNLTKFPSLLRTNWSLPLSINAFIRLLAYFEVRGWVSMGIRSE